MPKSAHTGKNPRQKQAYSVDIHRRSNSSTAGDDAFTTNDAASDIPLDPELEEGKKPSYRKKRRSGVSGHINKHSSSYIVAILSFFGIVGVTLYLSIGLPMYGEIQTISSQVDHQRELNISLKEDVSELEERINNKDSEIQEMFENINLKLQEQSLKLEFLNRLIDNTLK